MLRQLTNAISQLFSSSTQEELEILRSMNTDLISERNYLIGDIGDAFVKLDKSSSNEFGDRVLDHSREKALPRLRSMQRNNETVIAILDYIKREVIGDKPIVPLVRTPDTALNELIEDEFFFWATSLKGVDLSGERKFWDIQCNWLTEMILVGEGFTYYTFEGKEFKVEPFETDQLVTTMNSAILREGRRVHEGVEYQGKKPVSYFVEVVEPGEINLQTRYLTIPAQIVQVVKKPGRPTLCRGESEFSQTLMKMYDLTDADLAELTGIRASAYFGLHVESSPEMSSRTSPKAMGAKTVYENGKPKLKISMKPGAINTVPAKVQLLDGKRPGNQYVPFHNTLEQKIAARHSLQYSVVSGDTSKASYSSSRIASLPEKGRFREDQEVLINRGCIPVFHAWLTFMVLTRKIDIKGYTVDDIVSRYTSWKVKGFEWVDIRAESERAKFDLATGRKTWSQLMAEARLDPIDQLKAIQNDMKLAKQYGVKIPICGEININKAANNGGGSKPADFAEAQDGETNKNVDSEENADANTDK